MMVGRLVSFWEGLFLGAMLNFRGVNMIEFVQILMGLCHVFPAKNGGIVFWNHPI